MKTIYRYELQVTEKQSLELPCDRRILHVAFKPGDGLTISMWAQVDTESCLETAVFRIYGTGHQIVYGTGHPMDSRDCAQFIGTCVHPDSNFGFHVFEVAAP